MRLFNSVQHSFFSTFLKTEKQFSKSFSTFFEANSLEQYYKIKITPKLKENLEKIDEKKEKIQELQSKTNGNLVKAIQDTLRFSWTYNSNALEGSKLNLEDTIFFLQESLTVGGKPLKDFLDAQNHSEAIDYLYDIVKKERPIDAYFLRSLNAILLKGLEYIPGLDANGNAIQKKLYPGEYKKMPNYVIQPDGSTHQYVESFLVSQQVEDLCQWIDSNPEKYHPCIVSGIAHYNMTRIHPFQDGNGRGSRLLMNFILVSNHYHPATIEVEKRKEYLDCLREGDKGNLGPIISFISESLKNTQNMVLNEVEKYLPNNSYKR